MTVTWTRRNQFIEDAAALVEAGEPLETAFYKLGEYCEPYNRGERPVLGTNQLTGVLRSIEKRRQQIRGETQCQLRRY